MTPWYILDLALIVYVIGMLSLIGGGAMMLHAYLEDVDEEAKESSRSDLSFPRITAGPARPELGSRVGHQRERFRIVPGRPRRDG